MKQTQQTLNTPSIHSAQDFIDLLDGEPDNTAIMQAMDATKREELKGMIGEVAKHYSAKMRAVFDTPLFQNPLQHRERSALLRQQAEMHPDVNEVHEAVMAAEQLTRIAFCLPEEMVTQTTKNGNELKFIALLTKSLGDAAVVTIEFGNPDTLLGLSPTRYGEGFMRGAITEHKRIETSRAQNIGLYETLPFNRAFHRLLRDDVVPQTLQGTTKQTNERLSDAAIVRLLELHTLSSARGTNQPDGFVRQAFERSISGLGHTLCAKPCATQPTAKASEKVGRATVVVSVARAA